jgi:hypothetical protein
MYISSFRIFFGSSTDRRTEVRTFIIFAVHLYHSKGEQMELEIVL